MERDVIIALDFKDKEEVFNFLKKFGTENLFVKVGMELYYAEGPGIIKELKEAGHKIFLDLKLHDIPNTVGKAMISLKKLGVDMCNVHAAGGIKMMKAGLESLIDPENRDSLDRPLVIAVTQLTSTDRITMKEELLIDRDMNEVIEKYALNAKAAGLDGVVCSPLEANMIHKACGKNFLTVTPGIRYADDDQGDQARVTNPQTAREIGSDFIVVGRSITQADNPLEVYLRCKRDFIGE